MPRPPTPETAPRSLPIALAAAEVRAVLAGGTVEVRRPVKAPKWWKGMTHYCTGTVDEAGLTMTEMCLTEKTATEFARCPLGSPKSRLWVRETFFVAEPYSWGTDPSGEPIEIQGVPRGPVHYAADGDPANTPNRHYPGGLRGGKFAAPDPMAIWMKYSSQSMPAWASRLTVVIESVRVEPSPWTWVIELRRVD